MITRDEPQKPDHSVKESQEGESWQHWEKVIQDILGDSVKRLEQSAQKTRQDIHLSDQDSQGVAPGHGPYKDIYLYNKDKDGAADHSAYKDIHLFDKGLHDVAPPEIKLFNKQGIEIKSPDQIDKMHPVIESQTGAEHGIVQIFANWDSYLQRKALLTETFAYSHAGDLACEDCRIFKGNQQVASVCRLLDQKNFDLTFQIQEAGVGQSVTIDADSRLKNFELVIDQKKLVYDIRDGQLLGVKMQTPEGTIDLKGEERDKFLAAAESSLKTLRENNGLPEQLPGIHDSHIGSQTPVKAQKDENQPLLAVTKVNEDGKQEDKVPEQSDRDKTASSKEDKQDNSNSMQLGSLAGLLMAAIVPGGALTSALDAGSPDPEPGTGQSERGLDSTTPPPRKTDPLARSIEILTELKQALAAGKPEGSNLEKIVKGLTELISLNPDLKDFLESVLKDLTTPDIPGRNAQVSLDLNSPDEEVRSAARRAEIERLKSQPKLSEAERLEVARLGTEHVRAMRADRLRYKELTGELEPLYKMQQEGKAISAADKVRMQELETTLDQVDKRNNANLKFLLKNLRAELLIQTGGSSGRGGDATERIILRSFQDELNQPQKAFGWKTPASLELLRLKPGGVLDHAGADFLLVNKVTGDFMFIDPTQRSLDDPKKANLPELRKMGVISSPPCMADYVDPGLDYLQHDIDIGSPEYNKLRDANIRGQVRKILEVMAKGVPFNLADSYLASSTVNRGNSPKDARDRLALIDQLLPDQKALAARAISGWLAELKETKQGLNDMLSIAEEKAKLLQEAAKDVDAPGSLLRQADLLKGWVGHTRSSTLVFVDAYLEQLNKRVDALPDEYKEIARPTPANPAKERAAAATSLKSSVDFWLEFAQLQAHLGIDALTAQRTVRLKGMMPEATLAKRLHVVELLAGLQAAGLKDYKLDSALSIFKEHGKLSPPEIAEMVRLAPELASLQPANLARVAVRNVQIEGLYGVDQTRAAEIRARVSELLKGGASLENLHDRAALMVLKGMKAGEAETLARTVAEMRQRLYFPQFETMVDTCRALQAVRQLADQSIGSHFEKLLMEGISKHGSNLTELEVFLGDELHKRGIDDSSTERSHWAKLYDLVKGCDEAALAKLLGLPSEAASQKAALEGISQLARSGAPGDASAGSAASLSEAEIRGLDFAIELRKELVNQELRTHEDVVQFLKTCLDEIDSLPQDKKWKEADREVFNGLLESFSRSESAAVQAVSAKLSLDLPGAAGPEHSSGAREARGTGQTESAQTEYTSITELERKVRDPIERAKAVPRLLKEGQLRTTLARAGMREECARELENNLLSEKQETREEARNEIDKFYESRGRGGIRGFAREASGRLGALVMVAAEVLPWLLSRSESDSGFGSATWSGSECNKVEKER